MNISPYVDGINNGVAVRQEIICDRIPSDVSGCTIYSATVSADRPPEHYTALLIPYYDGVAIPLENKQILWQR